MLQKLIAPLALLSKKVFLTSILLISCIIATGQITINTPTLGFSQVCASTTFNSYNLSFSFSPISNLGSGNVFSVELSNASGSFASPTILTTSTASTSPVNVSFSFPTDVNGTGYRIRIKSSNPASVSPSSTSFSANYAEYNQPFTINNNVSTQAVCSTSNFSLSIDSGVNSPLNFSELTYRWYRNNVIITGQTSSTIPITQNGNYYVRVEYGSCLLNAYSNVVTVSITQSETLTINSQGNSTMICPSTGLLLSSLIASSGYTYQWYKDNILIPGATNQTYNATLLGNYHLIASNTACNITSNILMLTEDNINASLDSGDEINLIPGQTKVLNCTTNATNPSYTWFKDNVLLNGETTSSLTITETGIYKVIVKQNTGCTILKEVTTSVTAPSTYNLLIKNSTSYAACQNTTETLTIDTFEATSNLGTVPVASNIAVTYKWFKNNVEIIGANTNSHIINTFLDNGTYYVEATLINGEKIISNTINVKLLIDETLNISSDGSQLCNTNTQVTLASSVTNLIYSYKWYKVEEDTVLGTNSSYNATENGSYYLTISLYGCDLSSNIVSVEAIDESILITNYEENIEINEGDEITITVSGVDSYEWYIDNLLVNSTDEMTINEEGEIQLKALLNGCEIIRNFTISFKPEFFNTVIPNTITPNNDGINDTWIITEEFAYQNNVEIIIFSSNQQIIYQTKEYQNNWPFEPLNKNNRVFYYKIIRDNSTIQQGTLSVIQ